MPPKRGKSNSFLLGRIYQVMTSDIPEIKQDIKDFKTSQDDIIKKQINDNYRIEANKKEILRVKRQSFSNWFWSGMRILKKVFFK